MPIAVKALTTQTAQSKTAGTTLGLTTGTNISAYDTVVVMVAFDPSGNNVPTCTVSDGTNSYTSLGAQVPAPATTSAGTGVITQAFVFKYSTALTSPTITATFSVSITSKAMAVYCFTGCSTTQRNTRTTSVGTTTGPALTGPSANVGDVTIAFAGWEQAGGNTFTADSDTLNGSWDAGQKLGTTGGNTNTNITVASQYKIQTTAAGAQVWNGAMTASNWGAHMYVLQPSLEQITIPTGFIDTVSFGSPSGTGTTRMNFTGFTDTQTFGLVGSERDISRFEKWGFLDEPPTGEFMSGYSLYLDAGKTTSYPGSGTTWTDLSGNGRNGTLTNGPTFKSGYGEVVFVDTSSHYVTGTIPTTAITNVSVSLWVNITAGTNGGCFFKMGNNSGGYAIGIGGTTMEDTGTNLIAIYNAVRWIPTTTSLGSGWKFVTMVLDGSSNPTFYINDVLVSGTYSGSAPAAPTTSYNIGASIGDLGTGRYFNGGVGSVLVYSSQQTAKEVAVNFNRTKRRYGY